ncbi:asparagine synthase (glutamine-hydrolyzing) [Humidesulfovibrio sp.]
MCGICGIINLDGKPAERSLLEAMSETLAHRGPDGHGVFTCGPLALGHRRLAILDLSERGAQPMHSADGRYVITYNGELYNHRELRAELEALGHTFRSTSDTEVVLLACAQWGEACLPRFNGMFAFAFWDQRERRLLLARDRYGIKPLYYARAGNALVFASEHKALLRHPDLARRLDLEALYEYFTFQNIFSGKTLLQGVSTFPAAHTAWVSLDGAKGGGDAVRPVRYWDFPFQEPEHAPSFEDSVEELGRLFSQAVRRQLMSDVEVGSFLSGGVDSAAVTAVAATSLPGMKSFTCGFDLSSASGMELNFDERAQAERLSYLLKTEHYEVVLKAGDMERCLPRLVWHVEEPRVGQCYPNYFATKLAGRFCKVVLAGTGGDELFGGYPWRYFEAPQSNSLDEYVDSYYLYWQRLVPNSVLRTIFRPVQSAVRHVWTRDIFRDVFAPRSMRFASAEDRVNHSLYMESKTFLHGLLTIEDKLSMAHGLEVRVPFLDNDLVDFACRVPVRYKLDKAALGKRLDENVVGKQRACATRHKSGKRLLRKALERFVPESVCNGAKQGFSGPDASWFKGESIDYVRAVVFNDSARIFDIMDRQAVREQVQAHLDGKENKRLFIWSLLYTEEWLKAYG